MNIVITATGFLNDAAYMHHVSPAVKEYETQFEGLTELKITLKDVLPEWLEKGPQAIEFLDNNKACNITLQFCKTFDKKTGKVIGIPDQREVIRRLDYVLQKAAREYEDLLPPPIDT